jgi:hypothetical protein
MVSCLEEKQEILASFVGQSNYYLVTVFKAVQRWMLEDEKCWKVG